MASLPFLTGLKRTGVVFRANIGAFTLLILSDVLLVMFFGQVLWKAIAQKLYPVVGDMLILLNQNTQDSPLAAIISSTNLQRQMVANLELAGLFMDIIRYTFLLMLGTLVLWILFQGFDYWWLKKRMGVKFDTKLFVKQFIIDNAFYFTAIFVVMVLFGKLSVIIPLALWQKSMLTIGLLLVAYLVHMAFLSYTYMGKEEHMIKKPFRRGFRWEFIVMWAIIFVFIFIINKITALLFFNKWVMLIGGVFIVFTSFNLCKVYIMETAQAMLEAENEDKKNITPSEKPSEKNAKRKK